MPGGMNNTERIERLEGAAAELASRLNVHDVVIEGIHDIQKKSTDAADGHALKITVVEQNLQLFVKATDYLGGINTLEQRNVVLQKDVELLTEWKREQQEQRREDSRRLSARQVTLLAAFAGGVVSLLVELVKYYLLKPK
jgi:hypothetical protein